MRIILAIFVILIPVLSIYSADNLIPTQEKHAIISVDANKEIVNIPRRLFGVNLRPNMQTTPEIKNFIRQTGLTLFRYPDSIDRGYYWDWNKGGVMIRRDKERISPLSKIDNVVKFAQELGAELFFTTKIDNTSPQEASRWVAEMKKRGFGGSYWCLGNEPYFKGSPEYLTRKQYVELVNQLAPAMKKADPEIKIGIAWGGPYIEEQTDPGRDSYVLRHTSKWIDFIDFHFYTGRWEEKSGIEPRRIMAGSLLVKDRVNAFRNIIQREAPERADKIEIHIWEWNGPPWPEVGGIQSLATALFAADAIGEMAKAGVKCAIFYNLQEHACGLIPGWEQDLPDTWKTEPWNGRTIRPVAFAIQLWTKEWVIKWYYAQFQMSALTLQRIGIQK